ncbi:hypothetical protein HDU76_008791, partial [Blyttiomyces sp. JEL0837]
TLCSSPSDSYSCNGPKWNVSGLQEDTAFGSYLYSDFYDLLTDARTFADFNSYYTNLTVGGFTANMSLGGSTKTYFWHSYLPDGALGLCNPAFYTDYYPHYLDVQWFYQLGLTGDADRFAIFLPKHGAGNVGELTIGGTNTARYKGSIQWVDAVRFYDYGDTWTFNATTIHLSLGKSNFTLDPSGVKKVTVKMAMHGLAFNEETYVLVLGYLKAVYDSTIKLFTVDCNLRHSASPMTFTFDSKTTVSIAPDAYIEPFANDTTKCIPLINNLYRTAPDIWLGLPFMKQYYTVFDATNSKIGFATSVQKYVK